MPAESFGLGELQRTRRLRVALVGLIALSAFWLTTPGSMVGVRAAALQLRARLPGGPTPLTDPERRAKDAEIAALRAKLVHAQDELLAVHAQLRALRELEQVLGRDAWRVIPARVIDRSEPRSGRREVVLARGSRDGVTQGMPAALGRAVVGKVVEVHDDTCRLALLTDPRCRLQTRLLLPAADEPGPRGRAGTRRVVLGASIGSAGGVALRFIVVEQAPPVGTEVLTAGSGERVPPGMVIGRVSAVETGGGRYEAEVEVEPAADLSQLERVDLVDLGIARK